MCCIAAVVLAVSAAAAQSTAACNAATTKALVRTFAADYSKGRVAAIDRMFAPEPYFQWFSSNARGGSRLGGKAYDRTTLAAYFRARARVHERIVLARLSAKYDPNRNLVNFGGELLRSADDAPAARHPFKGAAACRPGGPSFIVWSM